MEHLLKITTISEFHKILNLSPPDHPLISIIHDEDALGNSDLSDELYDIRFTTDMYTIMFKDNKSGSIGYGRNSYDFEEGTLIFGAPGQVFTSPKKEDAEGKAGWTLLFHPDLLLKSTLSHKIEEYSYFSYEVNEALHMSDKESVMILGIVNQISSECKQNIDPHSQNLIISNLELLLNYCLRYYDRQFYTRTNLNSDFVSKFEQVLKEYYRSNNQLINGLPSSSYFGSQINMSPNYLSDLLKKETGKGIKEHVHDYVIQKAKNILLRSNQSVSEIAFDLGFEYTQSFSRLFKNKTGLSPVEFRSLN
jgi:AraC-like DNA-binding protein